MAEKSFLEIFKRYEPTAEQRSLLDASLGNKVRISRRDDGQPERVEVDLFYASGQPSLRFYKIEEELCELYELRSFRIFPKYPTEAFSISVMHEILAEAEHIGAVTHGFFADAKFSEADGKI